MCHNRPGWDPPNNPSDIFDAQIFGDHCTARYNGHYYNVDCDNYIALRVAWTAAAVSTLIITLLSLLVRVPKSMVVHHNHATLFTLCRTFTVSFDLIQRVEVVRSTCCYMGAACSFPRGSFTSFSDGVFFKSTGT